MNQSNGYQLKAEIKQKSSDSVKSIKKLLRQRSLVVAFALVLTGLGASITSVSFKTGIAFINSWRLELLESYPAYFVLPLFGSIGGAISGLLIKNLAPAAKGSGVSQIMGFLRHKRVPMSLRVGLVKLISCLLYTSDAADDC